MFTNMLYFSHRSLSDPALLDFFSFPVFTLTSTALTGHEAQNPLD
jgi:hypothetical protein